MEGDLLKPESLAPALEGIDVGYYLVHSLLSGSNFAERDRRAALNFARAARPLKHVVYLGGLQPHAQASAHLQSRSEVGAILRAKLSVTEFRAGPIIGSGSASFEMLRYLTERLPVMLTPSWIDNEIQPIAIRDVLSYLIAAAEREPAGVIEIGGEVLTFRQMMLRYARLRGLNRRIFAVPLLAPKLASLWVNLVTPIPAAMARPIIAGIVHPLVADVTRARRLYPTVWPMVYDLSVRLALEKTLSGKVETAWSGALRAPELETEFKDEEGLIRERRTRLVAAPASALFDAFASVGGDEGWLAWSWAWRLRGAIDKLVGGPGLRRGRRDPRELLPGESLDFWRVEEIRRGFLLRLRAEMRVPGKAWIEWKAMPEGEGSRQMQTAFFAPRGLKGFLYWYVLYPIHARIFSSLAKRIAASAEKAYRKDRFHDKAA